MSLQPRRKLVRGGASWISSAESGSKFLGNPAGQGQPDSSSPDTPRPNEPFNTAAFSTAAFSTAAFSTDAFSTEGLLENRVAPEIKPLVEVDMIVIDDIEHLTQRERNHLEAMRIEHLILNERNHLEALKTGVRVLSGKVTRVVLSPSRSASPDPPPIGTLLLRLLLPSKRRSDVIGDLEEEFRELRDQWGLSVAKTWYWWQVVCSVRHLIHWAFIVKVVAVVARWRQ